MLAWLDGAGVCPRLQASSSAVKLPVVEGGPTSRVIVRSGIAGVAPAWSTPSGPPSAAQPANTKLPNHHARPLFHALIIFGVLCAVTSTGVDARRGPKSSLRAISGPA